MTWWVRRFTCATACILSAIFALSAKGQSRNKTDQEPWQRDVVLMVKPIYPHDEHSWSIREGRGIFRLFIDESTGKVTRVNVLKSTRYGVLDGAAIRALRQWRLKPKTWKQIDVPVTFKLDSSEPTRPAPPP